MEKKFKKIFIPGGDGFLGSSVVMKLKERNLNFLSLSDKQGFDFRDFKQTEELFKKEKPDAVINCAAFIGGIKFGIDYPGEIFYKNVLIFTNITECCRLAGVKRLINPIPNCTYPGEATVLKENEWWLGPMHESILAYATLRKANWVQNWAYWKQYGLDSINLILPNMYGHRDHFDEIRSHALGAFIMKFTEAKKKNLPEVIVWGTGKPIREWLYVEDGAEALVRALDIEPQIEPINIGRHEGITVLELAELVKKAVGYQGKITLDTSKPDGAYCKIQDNTKMKEIFNWVPSTNLKEGIKKTVDWYLNNY